MKKTRLNIVLTSGVLSLTLLAVSTGACADEKVRIGWSQRSISGSDWWKTMITGGKAAASHYGAKLYILDASGDTIQQNQDITTLQSRGVQALIINPNDPKGLSGPIKRLSKSNVPIFVANSTLDDSLLKYVNCYVAEDQIETAARAGRNIAKKALKKWGDNAKIKLGAIGGFPGDVLTEKRYNGFMKGYRSVMKTHPNVKTVTLPIKYGSWKPDKALGPIRDMASANPDLNILFNESDVMLGGVIRGLKLAGIYNKMLIGSYDGGMNGIKHMVEHPNGPIQADASNQPWNQGYTAVRLAIKAAKGKPASCSNKVHYVDTVLVTPDNAKKYYNPKQQYVRSTPEKD